MSRASIARVVASRIRPPKVSRVLQCSSFAATSRYELQANRHLYHLHLYRSSSTFSNPKTDFKLSERFLSKYKDAVPPFGFNGLGEIVYRRTYSRLKADGERETWWETVERVVNGTYNMQKRWLESNDLGWDAYKVCHGVSCQQD